MLAKHGKPFIVKKTIIEAINLRTYNPLSLVITSFFINLNRSTTFLLFTSIITKVSNGHQEHYFGVRVCVESDQIIYSSSDLTNYMDSLFASWMDHYLSATTSLYSSKQDVGASSCVFSVVRKLETLKGDSEFSNISCQFIWEPLKNDNIIRALNWLWGSWRMACRCCCRIAGCRSSTK